MAEKLAEGRVIAESYANEAIEEESYRPASWFLFYQLLKRERRLIGLCMLVCTLLAAVIAYVLPVRYTSIASLLPPTGSGSSSLASAAALAGQLSTLGAGDLLGGLKNSGDLYAGLLKSRTIADELIDHEHLMGVYRVKKRSAAESLLNAHTDVDVDQRSTIVTISVTERTPELAQKLANDYLHALKETEGRLALTQATQRARFFADQLEKQKNALEDAEVNLKKTEEASGLIAPSGQTAAQIRTLADTQAQIAARQVELAALRQSSTEENPNVVRLKSEIEDLKGQLSRMESGNGKSSRLAIPVSKVPELELDYLRKEREVKYHEALFEILSRQYESARLDEAKEAPELQIVDTGSFPDTRSYPKRRYIVLGGFVLGMLAGLSWVFVRRSYRDQSLSGSGLR